MGSFYLDIVMVSISMMRAKMGERCSFRILDIDDCILTSPTPNGTANHHWSTYGVIVVLLR